MRVQILFGVVNPFIRITPCCCRESEREASEQDSKRQKVLISTHDASGFFLTTMQRIFNTILCAPIAFIYRKISKISPSKYKPPKLVTQKTLC